MRWKLLAIVMIVIFGIMPALMQDTITPLPKVVAYDAETGTLYDITAEGLHAWADMSNVVALTEGQYGYGYKLTRDHSKLLFAMNERNSEGYQVSNIYIADVLTGDCCTTLDPQDQNMTSVFNSLLSADGSQLLVSYYNRDTTKRIPGQLVVFDLETGAVVTRLDSSRLDNTAFNNNKPQPGIVIIDWTVQGVIVTPACIVCNGALMGMAQVWNPIDDMLSEAVIPFDFINNPQTLATGETVSTTVDPRFPNNPNTDTFFPVPNVVTYVADDTSPATPQVIYFNPDNIYIDGAYWIADGTAILIYEQYEDEEFGFERSDKAYVLLRDGTKIPVTTTNANFLAQTSDGWVMQKQDGGQDHFYHIYYRLTDTTVEEFILNEEYTHMLRVVEKPQFGLFLQDATPFPEVTAP